MDRPLAAAIAIALLAAGPAQAQTAAEVDARIEALFGDAQPFEDAFVAVQRAIASHDAAALAPWIAYPFRVSYDDQELVAETPEAFVAEYDEIVTDDIAEAVAAQDYGDLFVNSDGVMFGDGEVWMTSICEDDACTSSAVRIIAIQSTR